MGMRKREKKLGLKLPRYMGEDACLLNSSSALLTPDSSLLLHLLYVDKITKYNHLSGTLLSIYLITPENKESKPQSSQQNHHPKCPSFPAAKKKSSPSPSTKSPPNTSAAFSAPCTAATPLPHRPPLPHAQDAPTGPTRRTAPRHHPHRTARSGPRAAAACCTSLAAADTAASSSTRASSRRASAS